MVFYHHFSIFIWRILFALLSFYVAKLHLVNRSICGWFAIVICALVLGIVFRFHSITMNSILLSGFTKLLKTISIDVSSPTHIERIKCVAHVTGDARILNEQTPPSSYHHKITKPKWVIPWWSVVDALWLQNAIYCWCYHGDKLFETNTSK